MTILKHMNTGDRAGDRQLFVVVASVVEQEVAGELEKGQRKRWYW
jgi:hypothetical protein